MLLSDIIQNLSLDNLNVEDDSEINLTKRYQKYKCFLKQLQDPLNIHEIVQEIIQNLDLMHKRYKLDYQELLPKEYCSVIDETSDNLESLENEEDDEEEQKVKLVLNANADSKSDLAVSYTSDKTCVYYTIDHVCKHLKLDDSFTVSPPSSEPCDDLNVIYFYEKSGVLQPNDEIWSILHLPPVRNGKNSLKTS